MKCLNIIVFYDNPQEVVQYIREVYRIASEMVDVAIVVNSDKTNQLSSVLDDLTTSGLPVPYVFNFGENVGYLNALFSCIKVIDTDKYKYVILSNTDISYQSDNFFQYLLENSYSSDIGCIAPSVFATKNKGYSNPHYLNRIPREKIKRLISIFSHPVLANYYLKLADIKAKCIRQKELQSCFVYSPHGCYMIFTQPFIEKIKGYKYGVKLYSEESCIGELLRIGNYKCYYDNSIRVVHQENSVTGKMNVKSRFSAWRESLQYILDTFY